jgi:NAD(P)-dependent dehydrogenase (short-subunit alcohol dehydrogenase family)
MMKTLAELMTLKGRSAIVTGGAGHIGRAVCEALLEMGCAVSVLDRDGEACRRRCLELNGRAYAGKAFALSADLADETSTRDAVGRHVAAAGGLDILIHSAAFVGTTDIAGWAVPFEEQTVGAWDEAMRVNVTAAFVLAQEARPHLEASGHGSVILISSIYGLTGPDNRIYEGTAMATPAGYAASKGGLNQLCRYLATVLAPRIRVNTVTAGGVLRGQAEAFRRRYIEKTPLGRMAVEEDFKGAVAYLASDLSAYVTGHNLVVDGGWTAW